MRINLAKKIQADDLVANAQGGVRLAQAYRDRVSTIHQELILNEKAWLACGVINPINREVVISSVAYLGLN